MKLGTQTNSLTNHLYSRAVIGQPDPVAGMGATILCWTDRHAATIASVNVYRGRKLLLVQEDRAIRVSGSSHDGSAKYVYERNVQSGVITFQQERDGSWAEVIFNEQTKRYRKTGGNGLRIGERDEYRDPCF